MDITKIPALILPALMLIVVSIGAKFLTVYLSSRSQGYDAQTSLKAAFGLSSSGGELALVVAKGGADVGTTSSFVLPMVGTMTIITTFITPYLIKLGWKLVDTKKSTDEMTEKK
jgi:CPA2 family monovalent cation:H+ antiporter-2